MANTGIGFLPIVQNGDYVGVITLGNLGVANAENLIGNTVSEISKGKENN